VPNTGKAVLSDLTPNRGPEGSESFSQQATSTFIHSRKDWWDWAHSFHFICVTHGEKISLNIAPAVCKTVRVFQSTWMK